MKLIFSRFGGKKRKSKEIITYFPDHKTYIEPFLGSGAIFISKPKSEINILNDLDPCIYHVFSNIVEYGDEFDETKWDWSPDKTKWLSCREKLGQSQMTKGITSLYESLYVLRHSWSGLGTSFTSNRWKNDNYTVKLGDYIDLMKETLVFKKDYKDIIREFDSPESFFYLDPPYEIALTKNYYEYQTGLSLEELRDSLRNIQGKFLLSLDITPDITELFKEFTIERIEFKYSCNAKSKSKETTEYLIKNY